MPKGYKTQKTLDKEAARAAHRDMVIEAMGPMTYAQIEAAKGLKYLMARQKKGGKFIHLTKELAEAIAKGENTELDVIEVWEKLPNTQAYTDLMNRALDKPAEQLQKHEVTIIGLEERIKKAQERLGGE